MSLQGLPDFADSPVPGVFGPFEGRGPHVAVPDRLVVARLPDGTPDLRLQLYRGIDPDSPPAPYGTLDVGLRPAAPLERALADLRLLRPRAGLASAQLAGGFARLRLAHAIDGATPDLLAPRPLAWDGLGTARWSIRLSLADAVLLRDELTAGLVPAVATADFEIEGVAPRVDAVVRFDPGRLFPLLAALRDEDGRTTRTRLVAFFAPGGPGDPSATPSPIAAEIAGTVGDPGVFAAAMADWIRARHATALSGRGDEPEAALRLALPEVSVGGRMEWDLRMPLATYRPVTASFSPLDPAVDAIAAGDVARVIPPVVVVPGLFFGEVEVAIRANLPRPRAGLLDLGVTLTAPPRPPVRPQAVIASWQASEAADEGVVRLRLAPTEPIRYGSQTFVVLDDPVEPGPWPGPWTEHDGLRVDLTVDDFGVRFVTLGAEPGLLGLASIRARVGWAQGDQPRERVVVLDAAHPELAVALPPTAAAPTLDIDAEPMASGRAVHLGPLPLERLRLGLHSFSDYGPQAVEIEGRFAEGPAAEEVVALDLVPEAAADESGATTVVLTRSSPRRTWRYLATSPFEAGYRYRRRVGGVATSWSPPLGPGEPLVIDAGADAPGVPADGPGGLPA